MKEITVIARARGKKGNELLLEKALREVVNPTHQEAGCLRYAIHRGIEDSLSFVVIERWRSQEDLEKHLQTSHVQKLFQTVANLVEGPPEILSYELIPEGQKEKGSL